MAAALLLPLEGQEYDENGSLAHILLTLAASLLIVFVALPLLRKVF